MCMSVATPVYVVMLPRPDLVRGRRGRCVIDMEMSKARTMELTHARQLNMVVWCGARLAGLEAPCQWNYGRAANDGYQMGVFTPATVPIVPTSKQGSKLREASKVVVHRTPDPNTLNGEWRHSIQG